MKIISLLPAATEILCDLGLADNIIGVSEECNYPDIVKNKRIISRIRLDLEDKTNLEIDNAISNLINQGMSPYIIDEDLIEELNPDFIISQETCAVCAASKSDIKKLNVDNKIVDYSPLTLDDIPESILNISNKLGVKEKGLEIKKKFLFEINEIASKTKNIIDKPRVFAMEWIDPIYIAGHWVPDMINIAGGKELYGKGGEKSKKLNFDKIIDYSPNYIFVMPCGYSVEKTLNEIDNLLSNKDLNKIPAFNSGNVYIVDADSYYTRPGPRVIEGIKIIARTINPLNYQYEPKPDSIINLQNFIHFESFAG